MAAIESDTLQNVTQPNALASRNHGRNPHRKVDSQGPMKTVHGPSKPSVDRDSNQGSNPQGAEKKKNYASVVSSSHPFLPDPASGVLSTDKPWNLNSTSFEPSEKNPRDKSFADSHKDLSNVWLLKGSTPITRKHIGQTPEKAKNDVIPPVAAPRSKAEVTVTPSHKEEQTKQRTQNVTVETPMESVTAYIKTPPTFKKKLDVTDRLQDDHHVTLSNNSHELNPTHFDLLPSEVSDQMRAKYQIVNQPFIDEAEILNLSTSVSNVSKVVVSESVELEIQPQQVVEELQQVPTEPLVEAVPEEFEHVIEYDLTVGFLVALRDSVSNEETLLNEIFGEKRIFTKDPKQIESMIPSARGSSGNGFARAKLVKTGSTLAKREREREKERGDWDSTKAFTKGTALSKPSKTPTERKKTKDIPRMITSTLNKLSKSNIDRIFVKVRDMIETPEHLLILFQSLIKCALLQPGNVGVYVSIILAMKLYGLAHSDNEGLDQKSVQTVFLEMFQDTFTHELDATISPDGPELAEEQFKLRDRLICLTRCLTHALVMKAFLRQRAALGIVTNMWNAYEYRKSDDLVKPLILDAINEFLSNSNLTEDTFQPLFATMRKFLRVHSDHLDTRSRFILENALTKQQEMQKKENSMTPEAYRATFIQEWGAKWDLQSYIQIINQIDLPVLDNKDKHKSH